MHSVYSLMKWYVYDVDIYIPYFSYNDIDRFPCILLRDEVNESKRKLFNNTHIVLCRNALFFVHILIIVFLFLHMGTGKEEWQRIKRGNNETRWMQAIGIQTCGYFWLMNKSKEFYHHSAFILSYSVTQSRLTSII